MSIRARILALVAGFAVMALVVTGLGLATLADYSRMMREYDHAYENAWRGERLNHLVSNVVMETRGIYIARSDTELQGFVTSLNRNLDSMETLLTQWKSSQTPVEARRFQPVATDARSFIATRRDVAKLAGAGNVTQAHAVSTASRSDRIAFQAKVEDIVQQTMIDLAVAKGHAEQYNQRRIVEFFIACLIGIGLVAAGTLWVVARFITTPLRDLSTAIIRTSKGDYDIPIAAQATGQTSHDEVASVWQALAVLKARAIEAERLAAAQREADHEREMKMRELVLD